MLMIGFTLTYKVKIIWDRSIYPMFLTHFQYQNTQPDQYYSKSTEKRMSDLSASAYVEWL